MTSVKDAAVAGGEEYREVRVEGLAVGGDPDRGQGVDVDDVPAFADLLCEGVQSGEGVGDLAEWPVVEDGDLLVQVPGHREDLRLRQPMLMRACRPGGGAPEVSAGE
jgi:hypothetical protein